MCEPHPQQQFCTEMHNGLIFGFLVRGIGARVYVQLYMHVRKRIHLIVILAPTNTNMWQSEVEIDHYSIAFFTALPCSKCCNTELPLRVGLIFVIRNPCINTVCMSSTLNRSSALQRFKRSKYAME